MSGKTIEWPIKVEKKMETFTCHMVILSKFTLKSNWGGKKMVM